MGTLRMVRHTCTWIALAGCGGWAVLCGIWRQGRPCTAASEPYGTAMIGIGRWVPCGVSSMGQQSRGDLLHPLEVVSLGPYYHTKSWYVKSC
jgi:hypothetical protein